MEKHGLGESVWVFITLIVIDRTESTWKGEDSRLNGKGRGDCLRRCLSWPAWTQLSNRFLHHWVRSTRLKADYSCHFR